MGGEWTLPEVSRPDRGTRPRGAQGPAIRPFRPAPWLRSAHAQTMWSPLFRQRQLPQLDFQRVWLPTPDEDRVRLNVLPGRPGAPTVILMHGLEGSMRSNYMLGQAARFARLRWTVVGFEFRSCSGEINRARRLYHSGETEDLAHVVRWALAQRHGPLFLSGVSLSGNVLARWLGELGDEVPHRIMGAAAISLPYDLVRSGPTIDRAAGGLYVRRFLRTLVPKALAKERQYPGCLDPRAVRAARTIEAFDTHATAPLHGFEDAWDYWAKVSCLEVLDRVRVPLLLLSARDDPFHPEESYPYDLVESSPYLFGEFPPRGGHVGFIEGVPWRTRHWAEEAVEAHFAWLLEHSANERATLGFSRLAREAHGRQR